MPKNSAGSTLARSIRAFLVLAAVLCVHSRAALATSVIPISDTELARRADVVVHGIVLETFVQEDALGRPETVSLIRPLSIVKGSLSGDLAIHQLGGTLPDGRFFQLWGRPEYVPGREVVVFAIARPEGDFQTAEMLLGKFEVWQDANGARFAVPDLATGVHPGVDVHSAEDLLGADARKGQFRASSIASPLEASRPRELARFIASIRSGRAGASGRSPAGALVPVEHPDQRTLPIRRPMWGNINDSLWRWNNNATAAWTLVNTANITGGGTAEALGALASWTTEPNSAINYTAGTGTPNTIDLNAGTSGCGWSSCMTGGGVIGCGGPSGGGSNSFRGDTYSTITQGMVQLRCYATPNLFSSTVTQSVLTHELGHTLGLGHSDQNVSPHDVCRGDEDAATMRSVAQNRTTLGTDDIDAIRWIYGDGGNSCSGVAPPPNVSLIYPATGVVAGGTVLTITGSGFQAGATVSLGATPVAALTVVNATTIYATTAGHAAGAVSILVTNPDTQTANVSGLFGYVAPLANGTDLDGNGKTDLIWRNQVTGANSLWLMNGVTASSVMALTAVTDLNWQLVGAGDFNRDGKADLVWRNRVNGQNAVWLMNGSVVSAVVPFTTVSDTNWKIVGIADFNGDGYADIVWHNTVNGQNAVWLMNGTTVSTIASFTSVVDTTWEIQGVGDLNHDNHPDIIWRNTTNGLNAVWLMTGSSGTTVSSVVAIPTVSDQTWQIGGVGDFDGNGFADLIWRNSVTGQNGVWSMNGGSVSAVLSLPTLSDTNWKLGAPH